MINNIGAAQRSHKLCANFKMTLPRRTAILHIAKSLSKATVGDIIPLAQLDFKSSTGRQEQINFTKNKIIPVLNKNGYTLTMVANHQSEIPHLEVRELAKCTKVEQLKQNQDNIPKVQGAPTLEDLTQTYINQIIVHNLFIGRN